MTDLMTLAETMALLRVSRATVFRMMQNGLPSLGRGRLRRFDHAAVLRWYAGVETPGDDGAALLSPGLYACGCGRRFTVREPKRGEALVCPACRVWDDMERVGDVMAGR